MPNSLEDIFDDDSMGLLNPKEKAVAVKTDEDRMIDAFEEINTFFEKNSREPDTSNMSEYNLQARLKSFRSDEANKRILKPFDRFNLLGHVEMEVSSLEEILDDDDSGLLTSDADTSIFDFKHIPRESKRAGPEFIAQRKPMSDSEFSKYEQMFRQVHRELKERKREFADFTNIEKNLQVGNYYLLDGMLLFLESADLKHKLRGKQAGGWGQLDGRTRTIFENGTSSNMLFRSLGKAIQKDGKLVTMPNEIGVSSDINRNVTEEDVESGWIYVLKSKSADPQITAITNLYKIGFSKAKVKERIKNAIKEATYLFAEVEIVATYQCYNINTQLLETLMHRFFAEACLEIDVFDKDGLRHMPREWFCVPLLLIDNAIKLLLSGDILNYRYDISTKDIIERQRT